MMTVTFDKKLAELDAYLQMLIEQNENLDEKIELASVGPERDGLLLIKHNLESLLGSIKHAIVLLQIAKVSIKSSSLKQQQQQQTTQSYSLPSSNTSITDKNSSPQGAITAASPQEEQQISSPKPPARSSKRHSQQSPSNARHSQSPQLSSSLLAQPSDTPSISSPTGQQQHSNSGNSNISSNISNSGNSNSGGSIRQSQQAEQRERFDSSGESNLPHCIRDDNAEVFSKVPPQLYIKSKIVDTHRGVKDGAPGATSLKNSDADYEDDDDTFYDAADEHNHLHHQQKQQQQQQNENLLLSQPIDPNQSSPNNISTLNTSMEPNNNNNNPIEDGSIDWDALYEEEEEDLGSLENQGSVIKHLMSQIRIGMDLTKVVLPTFILERRSLLEMYADFFAHPDLFSSIPDYDTPEQRMIQLVRWYLSAFHAGRKSSVAKKPYNPILGEIFLCHWNINNDNSNQPCNNNNNSYSNSNKSQSKQTNVSESNDNLQSNNIERMNSTESPSSVSDIEKFSNQLPEDSLLFVAEQVSHHPPVSAFYAENRKKLISCCAHIYTKSKYLGLSVGVHNIGQGVIRLLKHNETYVCTFPSAYGRSILTVPWVELGGSVNITCEQTGYSASIEFVTKPFYGGKKHRVMGEILRPNKEPFMTIDGEWNGVMYSKTIPNSNEKQVFVDTTCLSVIHKHVRSISNQETFESRNVWKEVTRALKLHDVVSATAAKSFIEQRQRDLLKDRMEKGVKWRTRYFETVDDGWAYAKPLTFNMSKENDDKEK